MEMKNEEEDEALTNLEDGGEDSDFHLPSAVTNPLPRFKEALNLKQLLTHKVTTFEVDTGENLDEIFQDETEASLDETAFYLKEYFNNPSQQNKEIHESIGVEEAMGQFDELIKTMTNIMDDGKIKKTIVRKGNGKHVPKDGKVFFHYIAFADGKDEPFDSSVQRGKVEKIMLGRGECVRGLEIALTNMELCEISKFWFHYDYCYGKLGIPPRIPPSASCVFTVEVLDAIDSEKLKDIHFMTTDDRNNLPFENVLKGANEMKDIGNRSYTSGHYLDAVKKYKRAIDYLESYATVKSEDDDKRTALLFILYTNTAQGFLKIEKPAKACTACRLALKLPHNPSVYKIFYRFAQAKFQLENYEDAYDLCKKAVSLAPTEKTEISKYLRKIEEKLKQNGKELKYLYQKMFSSQKQTNNGAGDSTGGENQA